MRGRLALGALVSGLLVPAAVRAETFSAGSLIIPMDTTYQDSGMLSAYGLVYELLRHDIPVNWTIRPGKQHSGADFTASAIDHFTRQTIANYGYRGGPWVVRGDRAAQAIPVVDAWHASHSTTAVHEATSAFDAEVARQLVVAPTIAMFADGNQKIARTYVQAAGIPDSTLDPDWPDTSPDMLNPVEVAGPTTTNHSDGALFDRQGHPVYCQFMSMHWAVTDARDNPEVVAEVRSFLTHPVHFFAECQAVNAFENDPVSGGFLTRNGFLIGAQPSKVDFYHDDSPFAQIDGPFQTVGGSEPSYSLPAGDSYLTGGITMITQAGTPEGAEDVWMTGYLDGRCPPESPTCGDYGKVSYLGGHSYTTTTPISKNPKTQGVRLFLNALFEAPCATASGQPVISLGLKGPLSTTSANITITLDYASTGMATALSAILRLPLPSGATLVSASNGGTVQGGVVSWSLGNLGNADSGTVTLVLGLPGRGTYSLGATLEYRVGLNQRKVEATPLSVVYDQDTDGDGVVDSLDSCPRDFNPAQDLRTDIESCGGCGIRCTAARATVACVSGACVVQSCAAPYANCDAAYANGCEYDTTGFQTDPSHCGGCDRRCEPAHAVAACRTGSCAIGTCLAGWSDCNGLPEDGCEYDEAQFSTDPRHCGGCSVSCNGATPACVAGTCSATTCPAGTAECVAPAGDCETQTPDDPRNCGGCGLVCAPPHASGVCSNGVCAVGFCEADFADCNGLEGDGCEYPVASFQTDSNNCGACGKSCALAHAGAVCTAGVCALGGCASGWLDCNGLSADGCEFDMRSLASDPDNCGRCGVSCAPAHGAGACVAGACTLVGCGAGFVDLDHDPANGCEYACLARSAEDATCDGVDDDCDGLADEDFTPGHCGTGACTAAEICAGGKTSCSPMPRATEGPSGDPSCSDGADNDCDGLIDALDPDCGSSGDAGAPDAPSDAPADIDTVVLPEDAAEGSTGDAAGEATDVDAAAGGSSGAGGGSPGGTAGHENAPDSGTVVTPSEDASSGVTGPTTQRDAGASATPGQDSGCGCRVAGAPASGSRMGLTLVAMILLAWRRPRRRPRSAKSNA
jgi:MYXO-CTERM domain-containing protein